MTDFENISNTFVVKVCVVGDSSVGKSSLALRFTRDVFYENMLPTLGAGFLSKSINNKKGQQYKFQIWDTAGQERYKSLVPLYYHGASVVLIVFDVTNRDSLTHGAVRWIQELRKMGPPDAIYALVGNKADLAENLREVTEEEGENYAQKMSAIYCETSAKSGHHVLDLFHKISKCLENSRKVLPCVPYRPDSCSSTDSKNSNKSWVSNFSTKISRHAENSFRSKSLKIRLNLDDKSDPGCCYML